MQYMIETTMEARDVMLSVGIVVKPQIQALDDFLSRAGYLGELGEIKHLRNCIDTLISQLMDRCDALDA